MCAHLQGHKMFHKIWGEHSIDKVKCEQLGLTKHRADQFLHQGYINNRHAIMA